MTTKVTMGLTERDIENADVIYKATQSRNKAQAVSVSLSFTRYLIEQRLKGQELCLRNERGDYERIIMTELENVRG